LPDLVERAPAKVNLTLRVLGRRADGYHELESLVAFADLSDELTLEPSPGASLDVIGPFANACGAPAGNLVLKAAAALGLPAGRFVLDKRIPVAAGLGGGSADAAAALRLIARANGLPPDDPRLAAAALTCGADVPVCLASKPRIMGGRGEQLSAPVALPQLHALLLNPGVALATADVFAAFEGRQISSDAPSKPPTDNDTLLRWLEARGNDLTDAATSLVPAIGEALGELAMQPGCRLARMSGSGATCFALFDQPAQVAEAAQKLSAKHRNWWICPTVLG
jgi:4-diphosphocytidyl-2-C-methyl-D-erythritol kinase